MPVDAASPAGLALLLMLGARHGLDPDHVAVIDNLAFRTAAEGRRSAPWTGALFAAGHTLSVAAVAVGVSLIAARIAWPPLLTEAIEWATIALLLAVGVVNLRGVRSAEVYVPTGWRAQILPRVLRDARHPLAVVAVGVVFGLVFDTASQAAAWGLAASARDGVVGALMVSAVFGAGMILTDTADSQIVARLLRATSDRRRAERYRRGVGWIIVGLSFGTAAYVLCAKLSGFEAPESLMTALGGLMAVAVIAAILWSRKPRLAAPI